ncbi:MAG: hypothetical protein F4X36_09900 [Gammaproteobacteria bacterium]|nr:hypothetical protein [Gammaproteobacteria bacterium]
MATDTIPVTQAFHEVPVTHRFPCGITAHCVIPYHIGPARAWRYARHDAVTGARHKGWHVDAQEFETLTGFVYACQDDYRDDEEPSPISFYALVVSDDTDEQLLDPDAYDDPVPAALAADAMARCFAEHQRACDEINAHAARARIELAEANRIRREALAILRHARDYPAEGDTLGPQFARLWRQADAGRRRAFDIIREHRPPQREHPFDPRTIATPEEHIADAWRGGWDNTPTA